MWPGMRKQCLCAHKIGQHFRLWIIQCINETFANDTANNWESNTIYRTCIAYREGEIIEVM